MNGWVVSGVSLMLNLRVSDDGDFRDGGGIPFVLRLPGTVKGVNVSCRV